MNDEMYDDLRNIVLAMGEVAVFNEEERDDISNFERVAQEKRVGLSNLMLFSSSRLAVLYFKCLPYLLVCSDGNVFNAEQSAIWKIKNWDIQNKDIEPNTIPTRDMLIDVFNISEEYIDDIMENVKPYDVENSEIKISKVYQKEKVLGVNSKSLKSYKLPEYRRLVNKLIFQNSNWGKASGALYYLIKGQLQSEKYSIQHFEYDKQRYLEQGLDIDGCELGCTCLESCIRNMIALNESLRQLKKQDKSFNKNFKDLHSAVEDAVKKEMETYI